LFEYLKFTRLKIIFASANQNKIKEIRALLPAHFEILGLKDIGIVEDIPETGKTIKENSLLKARFVKNFIADSTAVFADDSGLEVEALNGEPGVYSARYAGAFKNDTANNNKLLQELKLKTNRKAQFITVITLILDGKIHYFEGIVKGTIAFEARGDNGFGYDPLFIPQGFRSTFAELSSETKNNISHRGIAVRKLVETLRTVKK